MPRSLDAAGHKEIAWKMTTSANFFDVLGVCGSMGRMSLSQICRTHGGNFMRTCIYGDVGREEPRGSPYPELMVASL